MRYSDLSDFEIVRQVCCKLSILHGASTLACQLSAFCTQPANHQQPHRIPIRQVGGRRIVLAVCLGRNYGNEWERTIVDGRQFAACCTLVMAAAFAGCCQPRRSAPRLCACCPSMWWCPSAVCSLCPCLPAAAPRSSTSHSQIASPSPESRMRSPSWPPCRSQKRYSPRMQVASDCGCLSHGSRPSVHPTTWARSDTTSSQGKT